MKRFIKTKFFLVLRGLQGDDYLPDWEHLYDGFTDAVMNSTMEMDRAGYCYALNFTLVELQSLHGHLINGSKKTIIWKRLSC
jgi:hypothetical protein